MIRARKLSKRFGDKRVLEGLDLEVPRGGFVLVTGPNGSGKTTLLRLCAGLYAPTDGELEVDAPRGSIGFLAHEPLVYRELTALENLDLYGRLYRVPGAARAVRRDARALRALACCGTSGSATFSRGMLQRLALCRTFLHDPDLLLLDEPFDGLDAEECELLHAELAERSGARRSSRPTIPKPLAARATARLALA